MPIFRQNVWAPVSFRGASDAQFFHFRLQRGALEPQNLSGGAPATEPPAAFLQNTQDVPAFGIFQAEMESTEKGFVFVNLAAAQKMLAMGPAVSEVAILLPEYGMARATAARLQRIIGPGTLLVRTWQQVDPTMAKIVQFQDLAIAIMLAVIFAIAALGTMNTMLMATYERIREFGILKALGATPWGIIRDVAA